MPHRNAVFPNFLDESIASTIVGNSEAKSRTVLVHLKSSVNIVILAHRTDLEHLGFTFDVSKEEVIETDLAAKETSHVDLVGVQGAIQDLQDSVRRMSLIDCQQVKNKLRAVQ